MAVLLNAEVTKRSIHKWQQMDTQVKWGGVGEIGLDGTHTFSGKWAHGI